MHAAHRVDAAAAERSEHSPAQTRREIRELLRGNLGQVAMDRECAIERGVRRFRGQPAMKTGADDGECAGLAGEQKKIAARKHGIFWRVWHAKLRKKELMLRNAISWEPE